MPFMPKPIDHVKLQAQWAREYETRHYLRNVPESLLSDRYSSLANLLWSTDRDGNVQQFRDLPSRLYALKLIYHVLMEQDARGVRLSATELHEANMRGESSASYIPPKLSARLPDSPQSFSKFGQSRHIRPSYERGTFRISPASTFLDPSLNAAQQDQELQHYTVTPNQSLMFRLNAIDAQGNESVVTPSGGELFRYMDVPDFYVWCCSWGCDVRTLHDFGYNALIFIHNQEEFSKRMLAAVQALKPQLTPVHGPVRYYDPYNITRDQLVPIFVKTLKYRYQNEYRFAWNVADGTEMVPFDVEIGPLKDIAYYYETV